MYSALVVWWYFFYKHTSNGVFSSVQGTKGGQAVARTEPRNETVTNLWVIPDALVCRQVVLIRVTLGTPAFRLVKGNAGPTLKGAA